MSVRFGVVTPPVVLLRVNPGERRVIRLRIIDWVDVRSRLFSRSNCVRQPKKMISCFVFSTYHL